MIKINKITVENFKNIQHAYIELKSFNVIVGPNNSGKSNFLKIIPSLNYLINGSPDSVQESLSFGIHGKSLGLLTTLKENFINEPLMITVRFSNYIINKEYEYYLSLNPVSGNLGNTNYPSKYFFNEEYFGYKDIGRRGPMTTIFKREMNFVQLGDRIKKRNKVESVSDYSSVISLLKIILEKDDDRESYFNAINTFDSILDSEIFYFSNSELTKYKDSRVVNHNGRTISIDLDKEIANLRESNKWDIFKDAIKEILKIRGVEIINRKAEAPIEDDIIVLFDHLGSLKAINQLSDGSLLLLALITKVLNSQNNILLIEEPENSTHPQALLSLLTFLRFYEDEKQFIITSHSVPLINELDFDDVIIAGVKIDGTTTIKRVSEKNEILKELRKGYISFSDKVFFD